MSESASSMLAFPVSTATPELLAHLHPALTAFPAAFLPIALLFELWLWIRPSPQVRFARTSLVIVGVIGTIAAFFSGYVASEYADQFFEVLDQPISDHHVAGRLLLILAVPLAALMWIADHALHSKQLFLWVFRTLLFICVALVCYTGYLGGELIFRYGAGVHASGSTPRALSD